MNNHYLKNDFLNICIEETIRHRNELIVARRKVDRALEVNSTRKLREQSELLNELIEEAHQDIERFRREYNG